MRLGQRAIVLYLQEIGEPLGAGPQFVDLLAENVGSETWVGYAFGLGALVVHVAALYIGAWRIFRPADHWPLFLSIAGIGASVVWMALAFIAPEAYVRFVTQRQAHASSGEVA